MSWCVSKKCYGKVENHMENHINYRSSVDCNSVNMHAEMGIFDY